MTSVDHTPEAPLIVRFELSYAEQVRAIRTLNHRRWVIKLCYAFFGGLPALLIALNLAVPRRRTTSSDLVELAVIAVVMPLAAYLMPHAWVRSARKNMAERHQGPHEWTLAPGRGIDTRSPGASASHSWSEIDRAFESREAYFLQIDTMTVLVLPKRALENSEERLRQLLRAELGPRARLARG